jgi:methyl-accepting chemotaxis protein
LNIYYRIRDYVLEPYNDLDYLSRAKAKYLFIIGLIFIVIILGGSFGLLLFVPENFLKVFRNLGVVIVGIPFSVYLIRKGKYDYASVIFLLVSNIGVNIGMVTRVFESPLESMSTYFFFGFGGITLCMLFSGVRMLSVIILLYVASLSFNLVYGLKSIPPEFHRLYKLNFFDGLVGLILVYSIGVLMIRIFRKNYRIVREQKAESERQNFFIKNVLKESAQKVIDVSNRLRDSVGQVSQEATEQASSSEEVSSHIEELESGIYAIALRAKEQEEQMDISKEKTRELSRNMEDVSKETNRILLEIQEMMDRYRSAERNIHLMKNSIESIQSSSKEMKGILKIITDISGRVNMLALNAAIEAARAGEAGRGFSVVADEISNLAEKTSSSVKNIDSLIHKNNEEISQGFDQVESAIMDYSKVAEGIQSINSLIGYLSDLTEQQSKSNQELEQDSKIVLHLSKEISESTMESKSQTEFISNTMGVIGRTTQHFTSAISEVEGYARNLLEMAHELNHKIESQESD